MEFEFTDYRFDYENQAWTGIDVLNDRDERVYIRCGHTFDCGCYGKKHEGEVVSAPCGCPRSALADKADGTDHTLCTKCHRDYHNDELHAFFLWLHPASTRRW